jgi:hypothetical protein
MSHSPKPSLVPTLTFGIASAVLFFLLFQYAGHFVEWAERTRHGEKSLFLIPVVVAFVFSYFHGNFTGLFWESLGLRAAKTSVVTKKK